MKIIDILDNGKPTISFEVFPPKVSANFENIQTTVLEIAAMKPAFMSVTYGAGGGTSDFTAALASKIQESSGVPALAHLTCVSSDQERVRMELDKFKRHGIENILALRGDIPDGLDMDTLSYHYASELVQEIKKNGEFCIGGACYPEGHPESSSFVQDIDNLRKKVEAGCEFLTTQMFFDNNVFYNFLYKVREKGVQVPIVAGIMPITNGRQRDKIMKMSGSVIPQRFRTMVDRFGDDPEAMMQAGIAFATEQIVDLIANGVNNIHIYTMNRPQVAAKLLENLSSIISVND